MIENQKSLSNSCKYCGWEFQNDIIQKIIEEQESVVCEFCGIEINISSIRPRERIIKENYEKTSNSKDKVEKKKKSIVKSISKLIKTKKYSVNVILGDKDFPKIFKENLIVVISRLIYKYIREWEKVNDVNIRQVGLTQTILITLAKNVKPIIDKRIHNSKLANLHKITPEEFEEWLKLLQKKIHSTQEYRKHFLNYLLWLTKLVFRLVSDMWEMKNLPKFQATIIKDLKNYPWYGGHESSIDEFEPRENNFKRNNSVKSFNNKFKIINNIYQGKYKGTCAHCNIKLLHTIDFHHTDSTLKENTWKKRNNKDWKETMELFEKEKVIPLCGNCHSREQVKLFNNYKDIILRKNLFEKTEEQIDELIYNKVKDHESHYNRNIKFRITEWLKKRSVIEQLYDGKCIGCGKITVKKNLPALQFHHRSGKKEADSKLKWHKIKRYDIKTICNELIKEDCVCLCVNCHKTIHFKNIESIATELFSSDYKRRIKIYKHEIQQNIQNFDLKPIVIINPLGKEFEYGDVWKKYLLHIFELSKEGKKIKTLNLAESVGVNSRNTRKNIQDLVNKGLITIEGVHNNRTISLTEKGKKELEKM
ncbi:MAG: hypothetical protein E3J52_11445 [Promethearchaeota archaeon]|nr:MAG: hypothetical protein E3J52_11445 [Candidatus Lokiarchaeota archaeon]